MSNLSSTSSTEDDPESKDKTTNKEEIYSSTLAGIMKQMEAMSVQMTNLQRSVAESQQQRRNTPNTLETLGVQVAPSTSNSTNTLPSFIKSNIPPAPFANTSMPSTSNASNLSFSLSSASTNRNNGTTINLQYGSLIAPPDGVCASQRQASNSSIQSMGNVLRPINEGQAHEHRRIYDLPGFSGRPEDWPMFVTSFRTTTEAYRYSELKNLMRLQKCLSGDARRTVECLLIHPRNVNNVISALEDEYGRPEVLIRSQIRLARQFAPIDESRLEQLVVFATNVRNLATFLNSEATLHHLANPTLLDELIGKLPISRRIDWAGVASRILSYPSILDFSNWLSEVARMVNLVAPTFGPVRFQTSRNKQVLFNNTGDITNASRPMECRFCSKNHDVRSCADFLRLTTEDRVQEVDKMHLCHGCLQPGHNLFICNGKRRCDVNKCSLFHSPMLHDFASGFDEGATNTTFNTKHNNHRRDKNRQYESRGSTSTLLNRSKGESNRCLLYRIVPVVLHRRGKSLETFAILDEASSITLIDADVAESLNLDGPTADLSIQWFGSHTTVERSRCVNLKIQGTSDSSQCHKIDNVRTIKGLKLPSQTVNSEALKATYSHLREVPFCAYDQAEPKILIGLDHHHLGVPTKTKTTRGRKGIVAAKTKIGWVVYGSDDQSQNPGAVVLLISGTENQQYKELSDLVRQHFTTEDFGVKPNTNKIETDVTTRARSLLESTIKRIGDRFETGLLWAKDIVNLPDSYEMALRRLQSVENK